MFSNVSVFYAYCLFYYFFEEVFFVIHGDVGIDRLWIWNK